MKEELIKGNFKVKNPVVFSDADKKSSVQKQLKEKALASLGGSMVYMERKNLTWEGENA